MQSADCGFHRCCPVDGGQSVLHGLSPGVAAAGGGCCVAGPAPAATVQSLLPAVRPFLVWVNIVFPNVDYHICVLEAPCPCTQALIKDALKAAGQLPWLCRSEPLA